MLKITIILFYSIVSIHCLDLCGDWTQYKDKKCFKVVKEETTQAKALETCHEKHSTLVTIFDEEEQEFINQLLVPFNNITMNAWIGLQSFGTDFNGFIKYKWLDQDEDHRGLTYSNWSNANKYEKCARMSLLKRTMGMWKDSSCNNQALIVCQKTGILNVNTLQYNMENMVKTIDKQRIEFNELKEYYSLNAIILAQRENNIRQQNQIDKLLKFVKKQQKLSEEQTNDLKLENQNLKQEINSTKNDFDTKSKELENKINFLTEVIENQQKLSQKQTNGSKLENVTIPIESTSTSVTQIDMGTDSPPKFEQCSYETTILEENSDGFPKVILQVKAISGRQKGIWYKLKGENINNDNPLSGVFTINSMTGEIYVLRRLDRDLQTGSPQRNFTVFAFDEDSWYDHAEVLVNLEDINDNAPFFPQELYTVSVDENDDRNIPLMTMTATDYDDPNFYGKVSYSIEHNPNNEIGSPIFAINKDTGVLSTAVCCLYYEINHEYSIKVVATDEGGLKGITTVVIKINEMSGISEYDRIVARSKDIRIYTVPLK